MDSLIIGISALTVAINAVTITVLFKTRKKLNEQY